MLFLIHIGKTPSTVFPHPTDQSESPCDHSFLTVTQSYNSNVTSIGTLHASAVLLCSCSALFKRLMVSILKTLKDKIKLLNSQKKFNLVYLVYDQRML